jgi:DNA polymerase I-like protein with 3'-5' exonuclease and polymerase domains
MPRTPTGKYQTNKDALLLGVKDKVLLGMLKYRAQLKTSLGTFMAPWLAMAEASGGTIHTNWNQTKSAESGGAVGTRTGRLSATWFMNIPKEFTPIFDHEAPGKKLPKCPIKDLPTLPMVRGYIVPGKGYILIDRDYSQQEPRILAHFDGGSLMDTYLANPWVDFHDYAKDELAKMGKIYERKQVKTTNLGLIYGMGLGTLAQKNDMSVEDSKELKTAVLTLYPGLKDMYKDMKIRARSGTPIRTWGGREYYCEAPKLIDGRVREFDYKMVNVLIQGSAADCTKEAILRFYKAAKKLKKEKEWFLILNVHDQLTARVPIKDTAQAMEVLRERMESVEFDVPILSEGSTSTSSWADLKDYDKRGKVLK